MDRLQTMRLFTRIVELGSFSRAAEQLGVPRASATLSVKQLESRLGVRLLARTTRQVQPTADGSAYYRRCLAVLAEIDEMDADFSLAAGEPRGTLCIDVPGSLCRLLLIPALPAFVERYPEIRLKIGVGDRKIDVLREGVDCVLRVGDPGDVPLVARRLASLRVVTCASAAYVACHGRPENLADLAGHSAVDYLSASSGKSLPLEFTVDGRHETRELPARIAVNNGDAYVAACIAGFGIIQVPEYHVARALAQGELVEILARHRPPPLPLNVLRPPNRQPSARLRVFIEWLEERWGQHEP